MKYFIKYIFRSGKTIALDNKSNMRIWTRAQGAGWRAPREVKLC